MSTQCVKLIGGMASVQVDSPLMKVWHDKNLPWLKVHMVTDDVGQLVVEACLQRRSRLDIIVLRQG